MDAFAGTRGAAEDAAVLMHNLIEENPASLVLMKAKLISA